MKAKHKCFIFLSYFIFLSNVLISQNLKKTIVLDGEMTFELPQNIVYDNKRFKPEWPHIKNDAYKIGKYTIFFLDIATTDSLNKKNLAVLDTQFIFSTKYLLKVNKLIDHKIDTTDNFIFFALTGKGLTGKTINVFKGIWTKNYKIYVAELIIWDRRTKLTLIDAKKIIESGKVIE